MAEGTISTPVPQDNAEELARRAKRDHINARARARRLVRGPLVRAVEQACHDRDPERRRQQVRSARKTYYAKHRDAIREQKRLRWQADEQLRQQQKDYRANHLERARERGRLGRARRRALERNVSVKDFTTAHWRVLLRAVGYLCAYCGDKFAAKDLTPDHITPLSRGGNHTLANIIPACLRCNMRKHVNDVLTPVQPFLLLPPEDTAAD